MIDTRFCCRYDATSLRFYVEKPESIRRRIIKGPFAALQRCVGALPFWGAAQ